MSELKDYSILDIEAIDDERFKKEKAPGKWVQESRVYIKSDVDSAIDKMKRDHHNERHEYIEMVAQLKAELVEQESENRRLKRALWLARANDASSFAGLFSTLSDIEDDESRTYWIFGNKRKIVIDGLKCKRMETSYKWFCIWDNVADKCRAMAEKYK